MSSTEYADSAPVDTPPELRPLTAYLSDRATSDQPAFTYVDYTGDTDGIPHTISWADLATRVQAVADTLAGITTRGQRVAILAAQELSYVVGFLGALHAGTIAVPLFAPDVSQHGDRLVRALADSTPDVWLTSHSALEVVHALAEQNPVPMPKQILAVDAIHADTSSSSSGIQPPSVALDDPAYLQYTSGSTRAPAGAIISHRAIVTNVWQARCAFDIRADWTCAGWIPFFHDMGLVQLLCLPVMSGARCVFITPFDFIMRPVRWLRQLSEFENVFSAAPNFAFDYAARKINDTDRATLDLSGVRAIINGSEPVRPATIARFAETFGSCGFSAAAHRPSYGLAEATVFVTNTRQEGPTTTAFDRAGLADGRAVAVGPDSEGALELVAAGRPHAQHVRIVHPDTATVSADGEVDEIWIHGANVADGYWQQPQRTRETFRGRIVDAPSDTPATNWLRTGDLGMLRDGLLYITGRIKDLIIIDGKNHYPQDIEATVHEAHQAIRRDHVAAFAVSSGGANDVEGAAVVAEYHRNVDVDALDQREVVKTVRRAVSSRHDVKLRDVVLVPPGSVSRTSSGKIARAATKERFWESKKS